LSSAAAAAAALQAGLPAAAPAARLPALLVAFVAASQPPRRLISTLECRVVVDCSTCGTVTSPSRTVRVREFVEYFQKLHDPINPATLMALIDEARALLCCAVLCFVMLCPAVLCCALLCPAVYCSAVLCHAVPCCALGLFPDQRCTQSLRGVVLPCPARPGPACKACACPGAYCSGHTAQRACPYVCPSCLPATVGALLQGPVVIALNGQT